MGGMDSEYVLFCVCQKHNFYFLICKKREDDFKNKLPNRKGFTKSDWDKTDFP